MHVVRHDLHCLDDAFHLGGLLVEQCLEPFGDRSDQHGQAVFGAPDDVTLEREDGTGVVVVKSGIEPLPTASYPPPDPSTLLSGVEGSGLSKDA